MRCMVVVRASETLSESGLPIGPISDWDALRSVHASHVALEFHQTEGVEVYDACLRLKK